MNLVQIQADRISGPYGFNTNAEGVFKGTLTFAGDYRLFVLANHSGTNLLYDADYRDAHRDDFPVVHVIDGENPPVTLRLPASSTIR